MPEHRKRANINNICQAREIKKNTQTLETNYQSWLFHVYSSSSSPSLSVEASST
jgi:hypothetical protein